VLRSAGRTIAMDDLTGIRMRATAGLRVRTMHRRAFRQLQQFVAYKAAAFGIATVLDGPACTGKACSQWGRIGSRMTHRFVCGCARRASDVNAALNHARLGERALAPRADVKRPYVEETSHHVGLHQ
jgi:transposase